MPWEFQVKNKSVGKDLCVNCSKSKTRYLETNCRHVPRWLEILRRQSTYIYGVDYIAVQSIDCAIGRLRDSYSSRSTDTCAINGSIGSAAQSMDHANPSIARNLIIVRYMYMMVDVEMDDAHRYENNGIMVPSKISLSKDWPPALAGCSRLSAMLVNAVISASICCDLRLPPSFDSVHASTEVLLLLRFHVFLAAPLNVAGVVGLVLPIRLSCS